VHDNQVFYQSGPGSGAKTLQLTNQSSSNANATTAAADEGNIDGDDDLLHGVADWLYEEEILQSAQAMWWSLDGQQLAFLTIDNGRVPHVPITYFAREPIFVSSFDI